MTEPAVVFTTTSSTRTITVTATDAGQITELRFEAGEYGHGAAALAAEIVRLAQRCTLLARARRREALAAIGLADVLLDRLGLPGPQTVAAELARLDAPTADSIPHRWVRAL
ncbi:hypothetical protein ACWDUL_05950 [Nocardia niigatensis]|uniref:hypothetical protein n=1 Tax=Nocardia niigatensis TaxID=209249 RepID=UPI0002F28FFF|nr:hypothetical protein [Nocardia niigatensis]